jgi:serralysin
MLNRNQTPRLPGGTIDDTPIFTADTGIIVGGQPPVVKTIVGTESADILKGTDNNDIMIGYGGGDELHGGKGADHMYGGDGDDWYFVDNAGDVVVENAGEGNHDEVRSDIDYHLGANVEDLYLDGSNAFNGWGNELNNFLTGNSNNNMLFGNGGGDHLDGGLGADAMLGGEGDDLYYVDNAGDVVWELADQGTDGVYSSVSYTLGSNVENLYLLDSGGAIDGTGNELKNHIDGNSSKNVLKGGAGDDWLDGKGGNDTMYGGEDNDIYVVDGTNDVVIENANQGYDEVHSTATYFLSNNVEGLMLEGNAAINGYGNDDNNWIYGNNNNNQINGYGGNDWIKAGGGKDTVDGGTGNDDMWGGSGNDTFKFHGDFGHDQIHDFKAGGDADIIEFDHNQVADFNAVLGHAQDVGGNVQITLDATHSIFIDNVNVANLHASDFHFV